MSSQKFVRHSHLTKDASSLDPSTDFLITFFFFFAKSQSTETRVPVTFTLRLQVRNLGALTRQIDAAKTACDFFFLLFHCKFSGHFKWGRYMTSSCMFLRYGKVSRIKDLRKSAAIELLYLPQLSFILQSEVFGLDSSLLSRLNVI